MRKFFSYGPINKKLHFYAAREGIIQKAQAQLVGEAPEEGGHYITVWAPRQSGKTWIMNEVLLRLMEDDRFYVLKLDLEHLKMQQDENLIARSIAQDIIRCLKLKNATVDILDDFHTLFLKGVLKKPLILILDEFDSLAEEAISCLAGVFRNIYNIRQKDPNPSEKKEYLLHGIALMGVRSVLGIENVKGSPFNVQRSLHIPNLTMEETGAMFKWYEKESGQKVKHEVIDRAFFETRGQPGLVSWFGELLTEGFEYFKPDLKKPLTVKEFEEVYVAAIQVLPNNNILNIISKAKQEPYKTFVLELFKTREKIQFRFDNPHLNFLYMNGVIDVERGDGFFARFSCPFVQKRLFNYFSGEIFSTMDHIYDPFEDLDSIVNEAGVNIVNLMALYQKYLDQNRKWLLKDAPRRKTDLRIFEAVHHFNIYMYLKQFFQDKDGQVYPEFPTGNGYVDIIIHYKDKIYALELKAFKDVSAYKKALIRAAEYGKGLGLDHVYLIFFVEEIDETNRQRLEKGFYDKSKGLKVKPLFVVTGR